MHTADVLGILACILSISVLAHFESLKESKNEGCRKFFFIFVWFCFFPFQLQPIFEIVSEKKAGFRKENTVTEAIYSVVQTFFVLLLLLLLLFYTRNSTSTRGRTWDRRESRQKKKTSRSMDVSMYAKTYDALHFRYSRPLLDLN